MRGERRPGDDSTTHVHGDKPVGDVLGDSQTHPRRFEDGFADGVECSGDIPERCEDLGAGFVRVRQEVGNVKNG